MTELELQAAMKEMGARGGRKTAKKPGHMSRAGKASAVARRLKKAAQAVDNSPLDRNKPLL